jgi:bifunctional NMN adenylyltransferase/nudix hydrolase
MPLLSVYISRFQPLTRDDVTRLRQARATSDFTLVLIAGAGRPPRVSAPISWHAIAAGLTRQLDAGPDWTVFPLLDTLYDDATWVSHVRQCVDLIKEQKGWDEVEVRLIGQTDLNAKRTRTFFPDWTSTMQREQAASLDAYYAAGCPGLSEATKTRLLAQKAVLDEEQARLEHASAALGYPVVLNTADAVVIQSNLLLVLEENGLLRLPGAHIGAMETGLETALRAAREKGGLDMPRGALEGRLTCSRDFDHPLRSDRGRVRTEAFVFQLPTSGKLEPIKPGRGRWIGFHDVRPDRFFEDHYDICQALLRGIWCDQRSLMGLS